MKDVYDLLEELKTLGARVYAIDDKIKIDIEKNALTKEISERIKYYRNDILAIIGETSKKESLMRIEKVADGLSYPISDAQRRLWVLSQFEEGSVSYNMPAHVYLHGSYDIENFSRAIHATIARHEILRTVFKEDETRTIRQWVLKKDDLDFRIDQQDLRNEQQKDEKIKAYLAADSYKPFDLEKGPLLRAALLQVEDNAYIFYYNMHHIISDGWSMEVLKKDVLSYYAAYTENREPSLKPLAIQYRDYACWQLAQQEAEEFKTHRAYWLNTLSGELPLLDLPGSKQRPRLKSSNGKVLSTYLDKELSEALKAYCQLHGGTLFMGILASLNAFFYRYTGQCDVILGSPIAGREHASLEDQIGFYVNTLALRTQLDGEEHFDSLFRRVKENTLESYGHQLYPFDRLVEELGLSRDTSRSAVFDVMLVLQNNGENTRGTDPLSNGLSVDDIIDHGVKPSKFDVLISVQEQGDYLSFSVEYNTDVYEKEMMEGFIVHYKSFLSQVLSSSNESIGRIDYLSGNEKAQLLRWNETEADYSCETVMELFEGQVRNTPGKIALRFEDKSLTYQQLNEQSNVLSDVLKEKYQVCRGTQVGVMLERSLGSVISMMGVMKTGACYVPIDHDYPTERVSYIIEDSQLSVLISEGSLHKKHGIKPIQVLDLNKVDLLNGNRNNPVNTNDLDDCSYVIYTSGSTGQPKGVVQTHRMLSNLIQWDIHHSGIERALKHLQYTSFSFDVSLQDCWSVLNAGGTVYIASEKIRMDFSSLWSYILANEIGVLSFPFSAFQQLAIQNFNADSKAGEIKHIVCSGEQLMINSLVENFLKNNPKLSLHNHYGPSETHVVTSHVMSSVLGNVEHRASIGKPVSNSSIYILDAYHHLVPAGITGELYIGGANLAMGYLNKEVLTKEKFIANPFGAGKLYKTGDQGYWRVDGNIEFIGRRDDQVKIRGYRIELGEIEQALQNHEGIEAAVVLAKANQDKEQELVAYITSKSIQHVNDLRSYLRSILPDYMLPSYYVQLESFPLTGNGKVDKRALPAPEGLGLSSGVEYVAPRNAIEEKLVKLWEELLQRKDIGVRDDFFALGGHSLKAVRLSNAYQQELSVKIGLKDLFAHTSIESHAALINGSKKESLMRIEKATDALNYPISDAQRRLWVLSQFEEGSVSYNMPAHVYLHGSYDIENFSRAIHATIARHEILCTVFKEDETRTIRQWVLQKEALGFEIDYQDLRNEQQKDEKIKAYLAADSYRPFDLEKGPLLRAALLQVEDSTYIFYYNMHHIISDGWSMEVLKKDVLSYYAAYTENREPSLKPLVIQYRDYACWQLAQQEAEEFKTHRAYWLNTLSGELPLLDLPGSKQRPRLKSSNGRVLSTYLNKSLSDDLKRYAHAHGGTLFMGILASLNAFFYRYTGQCDVILGSPIAGRGHADLSDQIGFYVNTLALRTQLDGEENFDSLFRRVKENTLESYGHQLYPFDRLVEELGLSRDTSRSAVFDVMLVLQNNGENTGGTDPLSNGLSADDIIDHGVKPCKFDVLISVEERGAYLSFSVEYNTDVYEKEMMEGFIVHYKSFLSQVLSSSNESIGRIDYLSGNEKAQLLRWNETEADYSCETVMELFEGQVRNTPGKIALRFEDKSLTYQQLNEQSNVLSDVLKEKYQVCRGTQVGVMLERSLGSVISMMGVMKTGACYVPIDHDYPTERVSYIIEDSQLSVLISEGSLHKKHGIKPIQVLDLNKVDLLNGNRNNPVNTNELDDCSYVIYTSGSTGQPKGVVQTHRMLSNLIQWDIHHSGIERGLKYLQYASFSFDASLHDLYFTLSSGGSAYIVNDACRLDYEGLKEVIVREGIEVLSMPFSALNAFCLSVGIDRLKNHSIKYIVSTAEQLYVNAGLNTFLENNPDVELHNHYGPSETHVVTSYIMSSALGNVESRASIGKPISNSSIYILDAYQNLVPEGITGELYIGGANLAIGYLNKEVLTNEKFIANPFGPGKLYKTGDQGYWRADGNIEFIGRTDDQVKIRGYRIELGEIEHALQNHEGIEAAVVLAKANQDKEQELVAYITSKVVQHVSELRSYLRSILPDYMLPSYYVQLESFPLTGNGKIDKRALPAPEGLGLSSGVEYIAPRNAIEEKLVKIWEEVLQRKDIGVRDDFFALGGHSLKAVRLSNAYQQELSVKIGLKDLFAHTSIESHAALINGSKKESLMRIEKATDALNYPISDAQRRLWVLSQFEEGSVSYNMPAHVYLNGSYSIKNFSKAIHSTIERHEILRTVFKEDETRTIRQWVLQKEALGFEIDYQDLRNEQQKDEKIKAYLAADSYRPFDLEKGPLLRAALLQVEDSTYIFYYNMHHIISDGWSMEVLKKDVLSYYAAYTENREPSLKPLVIQYRDYACWQLAQQEAEEFKTHRAYWLNTLSGELPLLDLPGNKQRPRVKSSNGRVLSTYLNKSLSDDLKRYAHAHGGTLFMGILASLNAFFYHYTGQCDVILGSPIAGRGHADLSDQIGFYVNTLALRTQLDGEEHFDSLFSRVKASTLESYAHQLYPFDRLVEELGLSRDTSRSAVFDVMLVLQNNGENTGGTDPLSNGLSVDDIIDHGVKPCKFDVLISVEERGAYLSFSVEYNTDVYEKEMMEGFIVHYKSFLSQLLSFSKVSIGRIDYLSGNEKAQLLRWNETEADYSCETVMELFEGQVRNTPGKIALRFEDKSLTYQQLNEQSNVLSDVLKEKYQVCRGTQVGVMLERSLGSVISMMGVMKTGACYVPIDHDYPSERVSYIIEDSQLSVLISEGSLYKKHGIPSNEVLDLNEVDLLNGNRNNPVNTNDLDDGSYVIYTSGSTGQPKGVVQTHRMLSNLIQWDIHHSGIERALKHLQYTSFSFDVSLQDCWSVLNAGGTVYIASEKIRMDFSSLWSYILANEIGVLSFPFSAFQQLAIQNFNADSKAGEIKHIVCSGEQLMINSLVENFLKNNPRLSLHNHYGPSETHVVTSHVMSSVLGNVEHRASIGKPVSNSSIYILDAYHHLVPAGITGELYIGGANLAMGYLNKEVLTKEKFIANPFGAGKLYKTGDQGYWRVDGNIEFIGRRDDQVKIRGYRIELGEIEQALLKNTQLEGAVVLVTKNTAGEQELVAYITSKSVQHVNDLRSYLRSILPDYMLPSYYVQLESFPLTGNGKVDKRALPAPEGLGLSSGVEYVAPRDAVEEKLVKLWEELLQRKDIGVRDDFFALGGHSLKAVRLSNAYQQELSVKIGLKDLFAHTSIESHAALINGSKRESLMRIEKVADGLSYPISNAQHRLWILSQFEDGSVAYNIPGVAYLNQDIDIHYFKSAIDATIARHEILRTVFKEDETRTIRQWVLKKDDLDFRIDHQDLRNEQHKDEQVKAYIAADSYRPFDLEKGPLLRAALLQVEDNAYIFYYNMHHIISDGWSMEVLKKDVLRYYEAYTEQKEPALKTLDIQYRDYACWQLAQLEEEVFKTHRTYWLNALSGELPLIDLPSIKPRPRIKTHNGHGLGTCIGSETTNKLRSYSQEKGGSLFMSLLAAWNILIYRYTLQTDIIIGTPVAGREHADLEDQIGFYVNTLVLRNEVKPEEHFNDFYAKLKNNTIKSYSHQLYPFDRLVEEADLRRDPSRSAVFDVLFVLQNNGEKIQTPDPVATGNEDFNKIIDLGYSPSTFDLRIGIKEIGDYLSVQVVYNPDVYEKEMVEDLIGHYRQLINSLLSNPEKEIAYVDYLSENEKQQLLFTFNDTTVAYPNDKTIVDLFREQVATTPDHTAVVFGEKKLTYRELHEKSNRLAHYLQQDYGIHPGDIVGIQLERSDWLIISILGILKAGAAYVPIDPEYPVARKQHMLTDASLKLLITAVDFVVDMDYYEGAVFAIDVEFDESVHSSDPLEIAMDPAHLAYVIYTSGSTGHPKGVMVEHGSLVNLCYWHKSRFSISAADRAGLYAGVAFDASVWELFPYLLSGACLYIIPQPIRLDSAALNVYYETNKITIAFLPTPIAEQFMEIENGSLRYLLVGGEKLNHFKKQRYQLVNNYGPTESTVVATSYEVRDQALNIPIGEPVSNTQIYIVSDHEQLQPVGVTGEIWIGGSGLARGYLNQDKLTAEKFITNPFKSNERIYRTGDTGRWLADGTIEFIGRKDDQVKIRGYRIELGEIEHALLTNNQIEEAVVLAKENEEGEKELVAYITAKASQNTSDLKSYLKNILPEYMLPAYYVQLKTVPLTANGKIDKKSLPDPKGLKLTNGVVYLAPRNEIEEKLVKIWEEILKRENISVTADFFELGGHSLKLIKMINQINKQFGLNYDLKGVYTEPTIESMAEKIKTDIWFKESKVENTDDYNEVKI